MNRHKNKWMVLILSFILLSGCAPTASTPSSSSSGNPVTPPPQQEASPVIDFTSFTQTTADAVLQQMMQANQQYLARNEQQRLLQAYEQQQTAVTGAVTDITALAQYTGEDITDLLSARASQTQAETLYLPSGDYCLRTSVTLPAAVSLCLDAGARLVLSEGTVLTVQGLLYAPQNAFLFEGAGTVLLQAKGQIAYPQWFGAKGDGQTDDTAAIQAALDACLGVCLPQAGEYRCAELVLRQDRMLFGGGGERTVVTAVQGSEVLLRIVGSNVTVRQLWLHLEGMSADATAILLDNAQQSLSHLEIADVRTAEGGNIVRDVGGAKPLSDLCFYQVDCRDPQAETFLLRDCVAQLYMRHCVTDYNRSTAIFRKEVDYPAYRISGCVGIVMEQCDVLGSYLRDDVKGGHAFVLQNCAAVYIDRAYSDTLSGMGFWLQNLWYTELVNCGSGLNNQIGLYMESCNGVTVKVFKQFGRWELGGAEKVNGIFLSGCRNIRFENLQSLCNLGDAFALRDCAAVTVTNMTVYLNGGKAYSEQGNSRGNLVDGLSVMACGGGLPQVLGEGSAVRNILLNDGAYSPTETGRYAASIGQYVPVTAQDMPAFAVSADLLQQCFTQAYQKWQAEEQYGQQAQKTTYSGVKEVLPTGTPITRFGAKGDGVTDDTAALKAALETSKEVYFPAGIYRITERVTQPTDACFTFASGAVLLMEGNGSLRLRGTVQAGAEHIFRGKVTGTSRNTYAYPQWFGAKGDGVTDDTAAFKETMEHFSRVCIPYTEAGYLLGSFSLPSNTTLCGVGAKAPTLLAAETVTAAWISPQSYSRLFDVTLDMQGAADTSVALWFDTAAKGYESMRFGNLTVIAPGSFTADAESGNRFVVGNVHFDNITVLRPRAAAFRMTDFFGFVFLRNVTTDHQGTVAAAPAIEVYTNYGMILEDCTVRNSATETAVPAFSFNDSWAIWTARCVAESVGGVGFASSGISHCYITDSAARNTGKEGFLLNGIYYQVYGITAENTDGVQINGGYYLTFSRICAPDQAVVCNGCRVILLNTVQCDTFTEQKGNFLLCSDVTAEKVELSGKYSAVMKKETTL